jgi:hypothetical protein
VQLVAALATALVALAPVGCGRAGASRGAVRAAARTGESAAVRQAGAAHQYPGPSPPAQSASGPSPDPVSAVRGFVQIFINWDATDVAAQLSALAAQSIGQARSAMQLAAAQAGGDYELQQGGIANAGTIESIAPRPGHVGEYVVVTLEQTTATATTAYDGLRPGWHVAVATVARVQGGWALTGWQPMT